MSVQILSTKLSIPSLRSRVVQRPRLVQKINQGLECGFVLLSAPAGYGKSTLLSSWLSRLEYPAAWLTLDDRDNDPDRFFAYLVSAIRSIDPSIDDAVQITPNLDTAAEFDARLTPLVNQISRIKHPFYLVMDDYHVIQNQSIHQLVSFLLENRTAAFHLIIATRADPPLPLARLRARSGMVELRLTDLRFTSQEAADFLNYTMGLKVSPEDVARITKRTEGWIAGLQMAALSMQNSDDISSLISTISGTQHYIFDYLLEEILDRQSSEIQRFLLYTSILDQFSAPLCDALLAGDAELPNPRLSSIILDELEHGNLFIIPLDHEQRWYRYHPLFAELLRGYLQKNNPAQIPVLHTRASSWLEGQGLISDAIRHSFATGDWERVVRLISANIFALLEQNELNSVARQLDSLTSETNPARPWMLMGQAWLAAYTGKLSAVEPILTMAESQIDNLKSEEELQTLGGHIAAIRAYTNWIGGRREIAVNAAKAALEWLPPAERVIRCQAATLLGLTLPDFNDRFEALKLALAYARECKVSHVTIFTHGCWAWQLSMRGRLHEAYAACQEAIQLAQMHGSHQPLPTLSHVYSTLSFILHEWNDIEPALRYSKEAVNLARRWEQVDALHFALDNLGDAIFASGDVDGAFDNLQQAWQVAQRTSSWFESISISQEVEWYLSQGNLEAALVRLRQADIDVNAFSMQFLDIRKDLIIPLIIIRISLAQKKYSQALELASSLLKDLVKMNIGNYVIRVLAWQALAYHGLKQDDQALASLKQALTLAQPEGYVRSFIRAGSGLIPLLQQLRLEGFMPEYVDLLLAAFERERRQHSTRVVTTPGLVEPLSEREMEVIKLLAQGYTDKKIAESLVIARETVHKHLKNIYGKLDVHSRTEAAARARQLNLL